MGSLGLLIVLAMMFLALMLSGLPVAFALGIVNLVGMLWLMGGANAITVLIQSMYDSVALFAFIALPLFIFMGEIVLHSGLAEKAISGTAVFIGKIPGRLGVTAMLAGAVFGAASGSSMAGVATIGSVLYPEMDNKGYAPWLSIGAICCAGGLACIIPPSGMIIVFAGIAKIPVGQFLIAGLIPGLIMGICVSIFIVIIATLMPRSAPREKSTVYERRKVAPTLLAFVPLVVLIMLVIGSIFAGIATPSEAAAFGALGSVLLAAAYRRLSFSILRKTFKGTVMVTGMALFIITAAKGFAQLLAFTGAGGLITHVLVQFSGGDPLLVLGLMVIIVLGMGTLMDGIAMMLIISPIFLPVVRQLGMDPLWWALIMMVTIEVGLITPPFGLNLFVAKGIVGEKVSLESIYKGITGFVIIEALTISILVFFPATVTWLPSLMR